VGYSDIFRADAGLHTHLALSTSVRQEKIMIGKPGGKRGQTPAADLAPLYGFHFTPRGDVVNPESRSGNICLHSPG
jgi:hypothetical protein